MKLYRNFSSSRQYATKSIDSLQTHSVFYCWVTQVTFMLTFLSFTIAFILETEIFNIKKRPKMLQKNFEFTLTKPEIYEI